MVNYAGAFSQSELGKYFEWIITAVKSLCKILPNLAGEARDYNFETLHVCDKNIVKLIRAKSLTSCNSQSKCFQDC